MSEKYYHGVRVQEENTEAGSTTVGAAGLQVVIGTAPVNLAENPAEANTPVLCQSMAEAKERLGYSDDWESYTLCQAMYASFQVYRVAPVVFINVLDPKVHKKENAEKDCTVVNHQVKLEESGVLKSSVIVKMAEETLTAGTDYLLTFDNTGKLVITLISEKTVSAETLKVTSTSIDPEAVEETDIIGGYDAETGTESGLEAIRQVYPKTGMTPAFILAPGWSHIPEVGAVIITKCESINGVFSSECLLDLDTTTAKKYTDAPKAKKDNGYQDRHAIVLWPKVKVGDRQIYYRAVFGAKAAYMDASNDDVPNLYPSNRLMQVDNAVTEDGAEIYMDREQANTLNGQGIVTMVNEGGWRAWGNNTSAFPEVTDAKDRWIACRRMFTWMANGLITIYHERVDSPANFRLIESICDAENIRLNSFVSAGKLAGGRIEYDEEENSVENILSGQVIFHIYMAAFTPAEDILFILKFNPQMLEDNLSGGGNA